MKPLIPYVQEYPAEYFTGADVAIYIGQRWVEDVTGITVRLMENVRPIYGYASYTYDKLVHGSRLVQGTFTIAFRRTGYLFDILRQAQTPSRNTATREVQRVRALPDARVGSSGMHVSTLQEALLLRNFGPPKMDYPHVTVFPIKVGDKGHHVRQIQMALRDRYIAPLALTAEFDADTEQAVRDFQALERLQVTGEVDQDTLAAIFRPLQVSGVFDVATRAAVMNAQVAYGLQPTGIATQELYDALRLTRPDGTLDNEGLKKQFWGEQAPARRVVDGPFFPTPFTIYFNYGSRELKHEVPIIRALRDVELSGQTHVVDTSREVHELYEFIARDMDREE